MRDASDSEYGEPWDLILRDAKRVLDSDTRIGTSGCKGGKSLKASLKPLIHLCSSWSFTFDDWLHLVQRMIRRCLANDRFLPSHGSESLYG